MKMVLMGIQGSGKGTQAKLISDYYHIPHISVGDMFKQVIANGGPLGELVASYVNSGKLVPDEITVEVVKDRVNKADCKNGYILDGYPRTINQADLFLEGNSIDHVLFFELDEQIVLDRVSKRRVCPKCGEIYTLDSYNGSDCSKCGTKLIKRSDEDSIKQRIDVYKKETLPLVPYFKKLGVLRTFDLNKTNHLPYEESVQTIFTEIRDVLGDVND